MKKIILATKRRWNWKVFLVLVGLIVPAAFAILPYSIHLQNATNQQGIKPESGWEIIVINTLVNSLLIVILGGIGLALANRIGLGMPFVEGLVKREPVSHFRNATAIAWITAVGFVLLILFLQSMVFGPPMKAMFGELGIRFPQKLLRRLFMDFWPRSLLELQKRLSFGCLVCPCWYGSAGCFSMTPMVDQNLSCCGQLISSLHWPLALRTCKLRLPSDGPLTLWSSPVRLS
jgi:hypothetical protein